MANVFESQRVKASHKNGYPNSYCQVANVTINRQKLELFRIVLATACLHPITFNIFTQTQNTNLTDCEPRDNWVTISMMGPAWTKQRSPTKTQSLLWPRSRLVEGGLSQKEEKKKIKKEEWELQWDPIANFNSWRIMESREISIRMRWNTWTLRPQSRGIEQHSPSYENGSVSHAISLNIWMLTRGASASLLCSPEYKLLRVELQSTVEAQGAFLWQSPYKSCIYKHFLRNMHRQG